MIGKDHRIRNPVRAAGLLLVVSAIGGCASSGGGGSRLFPREYLVAEGFEIDWTAQQKGTAFLVEEKGNKVLKTQSLEEGSEFAFSVAGISSEQQFRAMNGSGDQNRSSCPSADELRAFDQGFVSSSDLESVGKHLGECAPCRSRLASIPPSALEADLNRAFRGSDAHDDRSDPVIGRVMAAATAILDRAPRGPSRGK